MRGKRDVIKHKKKDMIKGILTSCCSRAMRGLLENKSGILKIRTGKERCDKT